CEGGLVTTEATPGGTYIWTAPAPTDGALLDSATGAITSGIPGATYSVDYTTNGACPSTSTSTVTAYSLPTVVAPTDLEVCDDGTPDGMTLLDLSLKDNEISGGNPSYVVSYYNTLADAEAPMGALPIPDYLGTTGEVVFVRVEDANTGCFDTTTLTLQVEQAPTTFAPTDLEYCDPDSDGFGEFTLSDATAEVSGGDTTLNVTYHETQSDAQNNVNAITDVPYTNIVANVQTIYIRVESATIATNCASFETIQLIVNPTPQIPTAAELTPLEECDDDTDGFAIFDLPTKNDEILNLLDADTTNDLDPLQYTITFHPTAQDALDGTATIASPNAYTNVMPNTEVIWVRVEDMNNGCIKTVALELIVNPLPVLEQANSLELCDYNNPGDEFEAFTLEDANAEILNGQTGITLSYHTTQAGADNDTDEVFSPYINESINGLPANPQTLFVRAENDFTGCISTTTFDLVVNPLPSPNPPMPLQECDEDNDGYAMFDLESLTTDIENGEPNITITYHETLADAEDDLNAIDTSTPYNNIVENTQTIYVRAENDITGCYSIVELVLETLSTPILPVTIEDYVLCDEDGNANGFSQFDFESEITPQIFTNGQTPADYILSYHTNPADAITGDNPIVNTTSYTNTSNPQTIYIRLESVANGCVKNAEFIIRVELPPVINQPTPLTQCDDFGQVNDQMTAFDLTVKNDEITGGTVSWDVAYFETQAEALAGIPAIDPDTAYTNMMIGANPLNPQTLYVKVTDQDTGCSSYTTLTIRVLPNPTPSDDPADLELCDDNNVVGPNDLIELFDLTENAIYILNGEGSATDPRHLSYYTDFNDAMSGTNAIADPTQHSNEDPNNPGVGITPQTIYVRVTNGEDAAGTNGTGCYTIVDFDIIVNPLPAVSPVTDYIICELNTDDVADFDFNTKTDEILNGQDPMVFTVAYYESQMDADMAMNAILLTEPYQNTSDPQIIYVTITNTNTGCDATLNFNIGVEEAAQANPDMEPLFYPICDDNMETDGDPTNDSAQFDLSTQNDEVLDGQDPAIYTVSYYLTQADADEGLAANALPLLYENITNPQVIIVRVDNDLQAIDTISLDLAALGTTGLDVDGDGTIDTYDTNADGVFDLLDVNGDMVSDGFDTNGDGIIDFIDLDGDGQGDLVDLNNDGIVDNAIDTSSCYETAELTLQVNPLPMFDLEDNYLLCVNTNGTEVLDTPVLDTELDPALYSFEWSLNGTVLPGETGASLIPAEGGTYMVVVTDQATDCENQDQTVVSESAPPLVSAQVTTLAFAENHSIDVTATSQGGVNDLSIFEFSIDDGPFETNEPNNGMFTFDNVEAGAHIITVRDINGCGETQYPITVMDYPLYFTPNNDGYHDTWNIYGIEDQPDAVIYIYDRFGKLLKQLSPTGEGWDGTFNGNLMPTSDYWFTVEYREPNDPNTTKKQFKAHFTLKR
ncbi:T9SS type B sorting domain-containing protein, partial [Lacinutrix salivirga]